MHSGYHLQGIYCIPGIAPNSSQVVLKFIITKPCESYPHFHMRPLKTQSSFETCPSSHGTAPGGTVAKSPPWRRKHKTWDLIPGSGRFPGAGNGKPPQYPSLGNPKDRGAWWATVPGSQRVRQEWATEHTHTHQVLRAIFRAKSNGAGIKSSQHAPYAAHSAFCLLTDFAVASRSVVSDPFVTP